MNQEAFNAGFAEGFQEKQALFGFKQRGAYDAAMKIPVSMDNVGNTASSWFQNKPMEMKDPSGQQITDPWKIKGVNQAMTERSNGFLGLDDKGSVQTHIGTGLQNLWNQHPVATGLAGGAAVLGGGYLLHKMFGGGQQQAPVVNNYYGGAQPQQRNYEKSQF